MCWIALDGIKLGFGARGRNRTGTTLQSRDFKSLVSTNFTTRADGTTENTKDSG